VLRLPCREHKTSSGIVRQTAAVVTVVRKYPRELSCSNPPLSPQVHALVSTRWYVSANDTHCVFDRVLENMLITVRHHNTCRHNYAVEKGLAVGFFGQLHYCYRPYYPTARFWSPLSYIVSDEPFPDRSRPMSCYLAQMRSRQTCDCGQRQTMNHIVDTCPLTKFEGGLNLLQEADDDAVIWLESTATAALVK